MQVQKRDLEFKILLLILKLYNALNLITVNNINKLNKDTAFLLY